MYNKLNVYFCKAINVFHEKFVFLFTFTGGFSIAAINWISILNSAIATIVCGFIGLFFQFVWHSYLKTQKHNKNGIDD